MAKNTIIINKKTKKQIDIDDFMTLVPWGSVKSNLYVRDYNRFLNWMKGRTVFADGVLLSDIERFINGKDSFRY